MPPGGDGGGPGLDPGRAEESPEGGGGTGIAFRSDDDIERLQDVDGNNLQLFAPPA